MALQIVPSKLLPFQGPFEEKMISYLTLTNSSDKRFAFKIKTNAPNDVLGASPKIGVVSPNESASVRVTLAALKPGEKRSQYKIQVQTVEVQSAHVNLSTIWQLVGWRQISVDELVVCFVDAENEPHLFDSKAAVLNFAPVPSNVHVFGSTLVQRGGTRKSDRRNRNQARAGDQKPEEQNANWEENPPTTSWNQDGQNQNNQNGNWDQNNQNQNSDEWDQNNQNQNDQNNQNQNDQNNQNWVQNNQNLDQNHQNWDQNNHNSDQNNQNWDHNNQNQNWDQNAVAWSDPNANQAAVASVVGDVQKVLVGEVVDASFKFWHQSLFIAIACFVFGIILGKAGF